MTEGVLGHTVPTGDDAFWPEESPIPESVSASALSRGAAASSPSPRKGRARANSQINKYGKSWFKQLQKDGKTPQLQSVFYKWGGRVMERWQARTFTMIDDVVLYHKKKSDPPLGAFHVSDIVRVQEESSQIKSLQPPTTRQDFGLSIETRTRKFLLVAESGYVVDEWVRHLSSRAEAQQSQTANPSPWTLTPRTSSFGRSFDLPENSDAASGAGLRRSGWLWKRGKRQWNRRWFQVVDLCLVQLKRKTKCNMSNLWAPRLEDLKHSHFDGLPREYQQWGFSVYADCSSGGPVAVTRVNFCAESDTERQEWLDCLKQIIEECRLSPTLARSRGDSCASNPSSPNPSVPALSNVSSFPLSGPPIASVQSVHISSPTTSLSPSLFLDRKVWGRLIPINPSFNTVNLSLRENQ
eukprot:gene1874-2958_t